MPFDAEQRGILRGSVLALGLAVVMLAAGYAWIPAERFGLNDTMNLADRLPSPSRLICPCSRGWRGASEKLARGGFDHP